MGQCIALDVTHYFDWVFLSFGKLYWIKSTQRPGTKIFREIQVSKTWKESYPAIIASALIEGRLKNMLLLLLIFLSIPMLFHTG